MRHKTKEPIIEQSLEHLIAAARGIPVKALTANPLVQQAGVSATLRIQYLARVVEFWQQARCHKLANGKSVR